MIIKYSIKVDKIYFNLTVFNCQVLAILSKKLDIRLLICFLIVSTEIILYFDYMQPNCDIAIPAIV
jgi:hypothetical protein